MIPDITIKTYYLHFIREAKIDKYRANNLIKSLDIAKNKLKELIDTYADNINENLNFDLNKYSEYKDGIFNEGKALDEAVDNLLSKTKDLNIRNQLFQIRKYCNVLSRINTANKIIEFADKKINIKFTKYREYINRYYCEVHHQVLLGNGYKFKHGIGTLIINKWKNPINANGKNKKILDYAATNARKKELKAKGAKIYDDKVAAWYEARHIPYDAIDYRVYKYDTDYYEITIIYSNIVHNSSLDFQRTEYVHSKFRGMSYTQIADTCKDINDLYKLPVDIKYKLNILLYKDPTKYLNFIRNANQQKYKYREDYSKSR